MGITLEIITTTIDNTARWLVSSDANAYERYARCYEANSTHCPFLLKRPPDPTSLKLRDLKDLIEFAGAFLDMGEEGLADTIRFWTKKGTLDEYFETDVIRPIWREAGLLVPLLELFPWHCVCITSSLHGRC